MKKKLNLGDLKVKSFVTDLENKSVNTVKGGGANGYGGAAGTGGQYVTQIRDCTQAICQRTADVKICGNYPTEVQYYCEH